MLHCARPSQGDEAELKRSGSNGLEHGADRRLKAWKEAGHRAITLKRSSSPWLLHGTLLLLRLLP